MYAHVLYREIVIGISYHDLLKRSTLRIVERNKGAYLKALIATSAHAVFHRSEDTDCTDLPCGENDLKKRRKRVKKKKRKREKYLPLGRIAHDKYQIDTVSALRAHPIVTHTFNERTNERE